MNDMLSRIETLLVITESISVGSAPAGPATFEGRLLEEQNIDSVKTEVTLEEAEHCDKGPIERYDMKRYPFLAIDFFDGDREFPETQDKQSHIHAQPEECKSDCDFGTDLIYAQCVLHSAGYENVNGKVRFLQWPGSSAAVAADVTGLQFGLEYAFGIHQYGTASGSCQNLGPNFLSNGIGTL